MKIYFVGILIIILITSTFLLYIRYLEYATIFIPLKDIEVTPINYGLNYQDVYFYSQGYKLHGWYIEKDPHAYTVLILHGNAGNIGTRLPKIDLLYKAGFNVFIFNYRGYGKSEGRSKEETLYKDANSAYEYIRKNLHKDPQKIIIYGESLGSAPATYLAQEGEAKLLIVEGGFTNAKDVAKIFYPYIPSFLVSAKLDNLERVSKIKCPKLFIHSKDDEVIPLRLAKKLFDSACEPKYFLEITGSHSYSVIENKDIVIRKILDVLTNK